ncbi:hypothetical protein BDN71DRAFT_1452755 [Pleurotus eryngii]|uniref:Uncharacterized protein n=1 Tax=Pleurotus eryngii TaxID=5323 RepID=A0A9P6D571_PLEER|nr:hypothetical protein BDN71DRAFT_1452755 [Pleurotus eryngii]
MPDTLIPIPSLLSARGDQLDQSHPWRSGPDSRILGLGPLLVCFAGFAFVFSCNVVSDGSKVSSDKG